MLYSARRVTLVCCAILLLPQFCVAAQIRILPLGDSITHGNGSRPTAGYREYFNSLLESRVGLDYEFVGDHPVDSITPQGTWDNYYALPGGSADTPDIYAAGTGDEWEADYWETTYSSEIIKTRSLLDRFVDRTDPTLTDIREEIPDWVYGQPLSSDTVPNVILLHIGTNQVGDPTDGPAVAAAALEDLLTVLDYVSTQQDGGGNPYLDPDFQLMLAKIIPDADNPELTDTYNALLDGVVGGLNPDFQSRIHTVDMFQVDASFFAEDGAYLRLGGDSRFGSYSSFLSMINTDADSYLDWVTGLDEANPLTGTYTANPDLYDVGDPVHPNQLGYELIGELWYGAMVDALIIPEPTSLILLLLSSLVLATPNRHSYDGYTKR